MDQEKSLIRIENGIPVVVDETALTKLWDDSTRDANYLDRHYSELLKQYPDQWVAVYQENVVAKGATLKGVLRKVDKQGIRRSNVAIEYLDTNPLPLII